MGRDRSLRLNGGPVIDTGGTSVDRFSKVFAGQIAVSIAAALNVSPALSADLVDLIPGLYGGDGITMVKTDAAGRDHSGHFTYDPNQANPLSDLNNEIASQVLPLPVNASPGGFTYRFDPDTGEYVRTSKKLGLLVGERPQTLGKGSFSVGLAYTFYSYDKFEGDDLGNLHARLDHEPIPGLPLDRQPPDVNDWIDINLDVDIRVQAFAFSGTYGVTDRIDLTAVIPYVDVDMDVDAAATYFDADGLAGDEYRFGDESPYDSASGSKSGLGDIILAGKYFWIDRDRFDLAAALRVKLDTGDEDNFLGTGSTTIWPGVLGTYELTEIVTATLNLGYEFDLDNNERNKLIYKIGLDSGDDKFTAALEILGRHELNGDGIGDDLIDASAGFKWAPTKNVILSANLLFPLNSDQGLRSDVVTIVAIEYRD